MKDFYQVLGVEKGAEDAAIKAAYRRQAKRLHPDKHPTEQAEYTRRFAEVQEAYAVLSVPDKRAKYDRMGHVSWSEELSRAVRRVDPAGVVYDLEQVAPMVEAGVMAGQATVGAVGVMVDALRAGQPELAVEAGRRALDGLELTTRTVRKVLGSPLVNRLIPGRDRKRD